jgi:hypothetical protein
MDYGQACRQIFIYRITKGLPVTRPQFHEARQKTVAGSLRRVAQLSTYDRSLTKNAQAYNERQI